MGLAIWAKASARRKRLLSIAFVFVVAVILTAIGNYVPISQQDAQQFTNDFNQTTTVLKDQGVLVPYIFGNNLLICLVMFVPVLGPAFGLFVIFNSGAASGAFAIAGGYPPILSTVAIFITPIGWLEFIAYSTAMAESVWLLRRFMQGRSVRELRNMTIFVTLCTVILAVSAVIEVALVYALGG